MQTSAGGEREKKPLTASGMAEVKQPRRSRLERSIGSAARVVVEISDPTSLTRLMRPHGAEVKRLQSLQILHAIPPQLLHPVMHAQPVYMLANAPELAVAAYCHELLSPVVTVVLSYLKRLGGTTYSVLSVI